MIGKAEKTTHTDQVLKAWRDAISMLTPEPGRPPTETGSRYKRVRTPEGQETLLVSVWEKADLDSVKRRSKFCQGLKELVVEYLPLAEREVKSPRNYGVSTVLRSTETKQQGLRLPYDVSFLLEEEWPRPAATQKEQASNQKDTNMTMREDTWTILDKLDKISTQHQTDIHALETRTESKITDLKTDFLELRRDTREDIKEMKDVVKGLESTVNQMRESSRYLVIAIIVASVGIILSVLYGSWSVLGTLKSFIPIK